MSDNNLIRGYFLEYLILSRGLMLFYFLLEGSSNLSLMFDWSLIKQLGTLIGTLRNRCHALSIIISEASSPSKMSSCILHISENRLWKIMVSLSSVGHRYARSTSLHHRREIFILSPFLVALVEVLSQILDWQVTQQELMDWIIH